MILLVKLQKAEYSHVTMISAATTLNHDKIIEFTAKLTKNNISHRKKAFGKILLC